jgi:hypothetical protein
MDDDRSEQQANGETGKEEGDWESRHIGSTFGKEIKNEGLSPERWRLVFQPPHN